MYDSRMVPAGFDEAFLSWFRGATESHWSWRKPRTFEDMAVARTTALDFANATMWSPLDLEAIDALEHERGFPFPPDYRLFLCYLHATRPAMTGALFVGEGGALAPVRRPGFYDWRTDRVAMDQAHENVIDGLAFDVENNRLWLASWGARPGNAPERRARIADLVARAPKLVPIFHHRFLLVDPCRDGNPVLSIHQGDIIVYGRDLRDYLLQELRSIVGFAIEDRPPADASSIPFWGELIAGGA